MNIVPVRSIPTQAFSSNDPYWDNVSLLLPFNNDVQDISSNSLTVTAYNGATISSDQSKWGEGSIYFDGFNDYLSLGAVPSVLQIGNGDFTVEFWVFLNGTDTYLVCGNLANNTGNGHFWVVLNSTYLGLHSVQFGTQIGACRFGTTTLNVGEWLHIALYRQGTELKCFLNGAKLGDTASLNNFTGTVTSNFQIGKTVVAPDLCLFGHLNDLRITKGVARYVTDTASLLLRGDFDTPYTIKAQDSSDTLLGWSHTLTNPQVTDASFSADNIDLHLPQTLTDVDYFGLYANDTLVAKLQLDAPTTMVGGSRLAINLQDKIQLFVLSYNYILNLPFYTFNDISENAWEATLGGSVYLEGDTAIFNGSTDSLYYSGASAVSFCSSDFTMELLVNFAELKSQTLISKWNWSGNYRWNFGATSSSIYFRSYDSSGGSHVVTVTDSGSLEANVWYHIAVVREGTDLKIFRDNVLKQTANFVSPWGDSGFPLNIGKELSGSNYFNGKMKQIRIISSAIYT